MELAEVYSRIILAFGIKLSAISIRNPLPEHVNSLSHTFLERSYRRYNFLKSFFYQILNPLDYWFYILLLIFNSGTFNPFYSYYCFHRAGVSLPIFIF